MRRMILPLIIACATLAACRLPGTAGGVTPPTTDATRAPSVRGSATSASGRPTPASPSASAGPTLGGGTPAPAAPPAPLRRPDGPVSVLPGRLTLDAAYIIGKIRARVVDQDGTRVLAVDGAGIIANNGGGVVSNGGGNVISDNGSGVISDNGSGIIANHGGGYRLAAGEASPAADATLPVGTTLPIAGMAIEVRAEAGGPPLTLGLGPDGKPATRAYSGPDGAFEVYLPATATGNVVIQTFIPGATAKGLTYNLLAPVAGASARQVDEDTALVTDYMFTAYSGLFYRLLAQDVEGGLRAFLADFLRWTPSGQQAEAMLRRLRAQADERGVAKASPTQAYALARALTGMILQRVDVTAIQTNVQNVPFWGKTPPNGAIEGMRAQLAIMRLATQRHLADDPAFFDKRTYMIDANRCRPAEDQYLIRKPSDFGAFLVREHFAFDGASLGGAFFDATADVPEFNFTQGEQLGAFEVFLGSAYAVSAEVFVAIDQNKDGLGDAVTGLIRGFDAAGVGGPAAPAPPTRCAQGS